MGYQEARQYLELIHLILDEVGARFRPSLFEGLLASPWKGEVALSRLPSKPI
jgi:hypothetical protein